MTVMATFHRTLTTLPQLASPPMPDLADFMTTKEAAKKLGFHINSIQNMLRRGILEGVRVGGKTWLVSKQSIERYLKQTAGMSKNDPRRKQK